jgi:hypothetical protein
MGWALASAAWWARVGNTPVKLSQHMPMVN